MNHSKITKRLLVYLGIVLVVFGMLYFFSVCLMLVGFYRLTAMSISAIISPVLGWMIFPLVFWRPITMRIILLTCGCVLFGYGVAAIFVYLEIALPNELSGPYGLFNLLIYSIFPAVFFEGVIRFRSNWIWPNKALQRTSR